MATENWFFVKDGNLYQHTENDGWSAKKGLNPIDTYIGPLSKIFEGINNSMNALEYKLAKEKEKNNA